MIDQIIADTYARLDQTAWCRQYQAEVLSYAGGLATIKPNDLSIPTMQNVPQLSVVTVFQPGDWCVFAFDSIGRPIILGRLVSSDTGAQSIPMGEGMIAAINALIKLFNGHTHTTSGGPSGPPAPLLKNLTTAILSKSTKVMP